MMAYAFVGHAKSTFFSLLRKVRRVNYIRSIVKLLGRLAEGKEERHRRVCRTGSQSDLCASKPGVVLYLIEPVTCY